MRNSRHRYDTAIKGPGQTEATPGATTLTFILPMRQHTSRDPFVGDRFVVLHSLTRMPLVSHVTISAVCVVFSNVAHTVSPVIVVTRRRHARNAVAHNNEMLTFDRSCLLKQSYRSAILLTRLPAERSYWGPRWWRRTDARTTSQPYNGVATALAPTVMSKAVAPYYARNN